MHRLDRTSSSLKRGGGLCIYIHQGWCTDSRVINTDCSFRTGDNDCSVQNLRRGIKAAKGDYKRKVENHLADNPRKVWRGLQHLTNYKGTPSEAVTADTLLVEELYNFLDRFEVQKPHLAPAPLPPVHPEHPPMQVNGAFHGIEKTRLI